MLILKAQQSPWTLGRSMENIWSWQLEKMYYPLCMKTFGNGRKALQRNVKLSQLYNCTFEKMTNKVSSRCQICNHLPRKKCKSSYLSFVCRQKSSLSLCLHLQFVFGGRDEVQKKIDILKKWRGEKETKCGFNKRSITPPYWHSDRVNYNQIDRLLKDIQADKVQRVCSSQTTTLLKLQPWTDQDNAWVLFIDRVAWPPSGRSCEAEHTLDGELGCLDETCAPGLQPRAHCILFHIIFCSICATRGSSHVLIAHCILFHSIALPFLARGYSHVHIARCILFHIIALLFFSSTK